MLPKCTLCDDYSDPRHSLQTRDGDVYPLCDGCAPSSGQASAVADKCRATGKSPSERRPVFGHNEPAR